MGLETKNPRRCTQTRVWKGGGRERLCLSTRESVQKIAEIVREFPQNVARPNAADLLRSTTNREEIR